MKNKFNNQYLGVVLGLIVPIISLIILYFSKYNYLAFHEFLKMFNQANILSKALSLSVLPNLLLFFIFIWTDKLLSARGVLMATFILTGIIFGFKFFL